VVAKALAAWSSTAHPAATTHRTPMSISACATLDAKAARFCTGACSSERRELAARWQQLTNTSSGTARIALISLAPRNVSFDNTTPPPRLGLSLGSSPWPAMCTTRQLRSKSVSTI
jgi:hypothetical protein